MTYSRRMNFADIAELEELYNYKMCDSEKQETLLLYSPKKLAYNNTTGLSYPVKDGDYYFAFISDSEAENVQQNDDLNMLLHMQGGYHKKIGNDDVADLFETMERIMQRLNNRFPKLGAEDSMSRENMWDACCHILGWK